MAPVPEWASFFSAEEYEAFLAEVKAGLEARRWHWAIDDGVVISEHGPGGRLGLVNLAQTCHLSPRADWGRIVNHHFDTMTSVEAEEGRLQENLGRFETGAPHLAVRLFPRDYLDGAGGNALVWREDIEGTITALVFDLPSMVRSATREDLERWGKTTAELFGVALANVHRTCAPQAREFAIGTGVRLHAYTGDSHFTASLALVLDRLPRCVGRHGALVGIPHRHTLLCVPIDGPAAIGALEKLIPMVRGMFEEGPGSVSPELYWYRDGRYVLLPVAIQGDTAEFTPPAEFVALLNRLAGEEKGPGG